MKKTGKYVLRIIITIIVLLICGQLYMVSGNRSNSISHVNNQLSSTDTPTLLIPGWGGGTPSYSKMINFYHHHQFAQKVMTIWVMPNGKCLVRGKLHHQKPNQLIELIYLWNYTPTYNPQTKQLTAVLTMLHHRYHIKRLNIIAHSYGGSEWANAVLRSPKLQQQIKYQHVVLLGAPVDESFGGKTRFRLHLIHQSKDDNFKQLVEGASQMKNNNNRPAIWNLMGSKKGNNDSTDGSVPHVQSQMMRILVKRMGCQYSEKIYPQTSHFQLHQKNEILRDVARAIWGPDQGQ